jgi:cation transport regulator
MPYDNRQQLPGSVRSALPARAQDIYKEAYNNAYQQYQDPGKRRGGTDDDLKEVASRVAWSAVKRKYYKGEDGQWHSKDE